MVTKAAELLVSIIIERGSHNIFVSSQKQILVSSILRFIDCTSHETLIAPTSHELTISHKSTRQKSTVSAITVFCCHNGKRARDNGDFWGFPLDRFDFVVSLFGNDVRYKRVFFFVSRWILPHAKVPSKIKVLSCSEFRPNTWKFPKSDHKKHAEHHIASTPGDMHANSLRYLHLHVLGMYILVLYCTLEYLHLKVPFGYCKLHARVLAYKNAYPLVICKDRVCFKGRFRHLQMISQVFYGSCTPWMHWWTDGLNMDLSCSAACFVIVLFCASRKQDPEQAREKECPRYTSYRRNVGSL